MKYNIPFEIVIEDGKISISCDSLNISQAFLDLLSRSNHREELSELNKFFQETKSESTDALDIYLIQLLETLKGWESIKRSTYTTIRCKRKQSTAGKSAIYYHLGRDKQLSLSIHNSIVDDQLVNITVFSSKYESEDEYECSKYQYYVSDYPLFQDQLEKFFIENYSLDKANRVFEFIQKSRWLSFFLCNEKKKDFILPPVADLEFYEFLEDDFKDNYYTLLRYYRNEEDTDTFLKKDKNYKYDITIGQLNKYFNNSNTSHKPKEKAMINYKIFLDELESDNTIIHADQERRFPGTKRFIFTQKETFDCFWCDIKNDLQCFLGTNGCVF
jgi:hypothetical protein